MVSRSLPLAAAAWLALATSSTAYAYCRTHTDDPRQSRCPEVCTELGKPLFWSRPKLSYIFNLRGFPGLEDAELRRIIGTSFETWSNVRCGGESIGIDFSAKPGTTTLEVGPEIGPNREPNDNVIVHIDAQDWRAQGLSDSAFAITSVWYEEKTGEILGADIMFNGMMDPYVECAMEGCASIYETDLRNVATHEIGHFLGLSHSDLEDSTMSCQARRDEVSKRSLSSDDTAGLCAIYPPDRTLWSNPPSDDEGCSAGGPGRTSAGALGALLLGALGLLLRRRRR